MFAMVLEKRLFFYLMALAGAAGILARLILGLSLWRLEKAAANMAKSEHRLIKLIRAKYEHASMASDKVQNTDAFVDKFLYGYRTCGLKLHGWRRLGRLAIWLCALFAAAGGAFSYWSEGADGALVYYAAAGAAETAVLFLFYQWGDETHAFDVIHTFIVDYLENVCAHRMAKLYPAADGAAAKTALSGTDRIRQKTAVPADGVPEGRAAFSGADRIRQKAAAPAEGVSEGRAAFSPEEKEEAWRGGTGYGYYDLPKKDGLSEDAQAMQRTFADGEERSRRPAERVKENTYAQDGRRPAGSANGTAYAQDGREETYVRDGKRPADAAAADTLSMERRREAAREKVREAIAGVDEPPKAGTSPLAIQLDEARKSADRDAEERKVLLREILEEYLA